MSEFSVPDGIRANPQNRAGELALQIYDAALKEVRADRLVKASIDLIGNDLRIHNDSYSLEGYERILIVGAGKASAGMASALEEILGDRISGGVVVTKHGHSSPTQRIRILEASHPIPAEDSVEAGRQIHAMAESAGPDDLVICLLSGGASALMELPAEGVSLTDLQTTTTLMLRAAANITELNAVRSRLSMIKSGGLAAAAHPAALICMLISDVIGNHLSVVGSSPCIASESNLPDPLETLEHLRISEQIPESIRTALHVKERIERSSRHVPHYVLGDIWTAIEAARGAAAILALNPLVLTGMLCGDARAAGHQFGLIAAEMERSMPEHRCIVAGGETVVRVTGEGKGGRSQEFAVAAAPVLPTRVSLLAASTDGTDGPTEAAGGLVDCLTWARAINHGIDTLDAIENNDTFRMLEAAESLIFTGPTHTNVNDLVIIVRTT